MDKKGLSKVMASRRGKPVWVRLTNVSDGTARCYKPSSVVLWIPKGELPREVGRDDTLLQKEKELYEC
ncbi:hypothetical protein PHMEG_00014219 [Phytophthora megakarya]|uniref:Uncharacterized protein n=1 Tax=Phytophthora megakarya TaxID=4795 RepID=A0A225W4H7_9STRA|nr:hypothetical protein PHMEG_00014219 [Phytophthora megakarya]